MIGIKKSYECYGSKWEQTQLPTNLETDDGSHLVLGGVGGHELVVRQLTIFALQREVSTVKKRKHEHFSLPLPPVANKHCQNIWEVVPEKD